MEAIYLDCGSRRPQLKRNPLGGRGPTSRMCRLRALACHSVVTATCMLAACERRTVDIHIPPPSCTLVVGELTCPPVVTLSWHRDSPIPWYNDVLAQAGVWGRVTAEVHVAEAGQVDTVTIRQASNEILADAVRTALGRWRFDPLRQTSDLSGAPGERPSQFLTVEFLFRAYGCKDPDPKVAILPLRATLLVEIVRCRADHRLS